MNAQDSKGVRKLTQPAAGTFEMQLTFDIWNAIMFVVTMRNFLGNIPRLSGKVKEL
jgi:hypothetical protein